MTPSNRHPSRHYPGVDARREALLVHFGNAPFTTAQALEVGLTHTDLRSHAVTPILRGVFVAGQPEFLTHEIRCAAAVAKTKPKGWIAALDAARLMGFPVPEHDRVYVSLPGALKGRSIDGLHLMTRSTQAQVWDLHVPKLETVIPVTHPQDVVRECLPLLDLVDGVVLLDAILAQAGKPEVLRRRFYEDAPDSRCRRMVELARCGAASPMETKLRLLLVLAGLPEPVLQADVVAEGRAFRFDLAYPEWLIGIEYDGTYHFESEAQKHADVRRNDALRREGWSIVNVVSRGILRDPAGTIAQVEWLLKQRGVQVARSAEWTVHFPQRDSGSRQG